MGGVAKTIDKINPIHRYTIGSEGLDIFGVGAKREMKKDEKKADAARAAEEANANKKAAATFAPDAAKSSLTQQAALTDARRKRLLFQSTGRESDGLSLNNTMQTPTQQRTKLF